MPRPRRIQTHDARATAALAPAAVMREAIALAEKGRGRTRPNPLVGAIVVKGGRVVGRGWHRRLGGPHAERAALAQAGARARGATLYVTLEPCVHHGRTPPCVPMILAAGIARVVVAHTDPDPRMRGRGLRWLRREGVAVEVGLLADEARALNAGYLSAHERGRPHVALKLATSLDGRIAPAKGTARWITGPVARRAAHVLRARHDTIVVGAETLRADDPELTPRLARGPHAAPLRIVVSSDLDLPGGARLFAPALAEGTVVATLAAAALPARSRRRHAARARSLARRGVRVWELPGRRGRVDLAALCARLAEEGRHDVLVEGGARLAAALADLGLVDELWLFVAPKLLGAGARAWAFGDQATDLARAWRLERAVAFAAGPDAVFHGYPRRAARNGRNGRTGG